MTGACGGGDPAATQDAAAADVAVTGDAAADVGADAPADSVSESDSAADASPNDVPANFVAIAPCPDPSAYAAAAQVSTTADNRYSPACARVAAGATLTIEASAAHPHASARGRLAGAIRSRRRATRRPWRFRRPGSIRSFVPNTSARG